LRDEKGGNVMLRAMWTGSISFGLVSIPVKAVPAQSPKDIRFELLHRECNTKLQTKRYCPHCNRDVPPEETVRGYAYTKGQYVLVEQSDLDTLDTPAKHTLRLVDFVDLGEVDPVYFEKPYYLQPAPGGERTYALLHRAMTAKRLVGIGRVALRERDHLALVRPLEHALVMETIAFPDEVRAVDEAVAPLDVAVDERELQMAEFLMEHLHASFEPTKYRDDYREELTRLIETKVEGGTVEARKVADGPRKGEVLDLMEMLRKSVEVLEGDRDESPREPARSEAAPQEPTGQNGKPRPAVARGKAPASANGKHRKTSARQAA
jgi:DNA end-binding protein Ku